MPLRFAWDPRKATANLRKHGVSFADAASAFEDPLSVTILDPRHSEAEERFVLIGLSRKRHLVVIAHVERGDTIRIISARIASRVERRTYEEG